LARCTFYEDDDADDGSLGIRREAGDTRAAAVNPPASLIYDWPPVLDDVAIDRHSPADKQPCEWRRGP